MLHFHGCRASEVQRLFPNFSEVCFSPGVSPLLPSDSRVLFVLRSGYYARLSDCLPVTDHCLPDLPAHDQTFMTKRSCVTALSVAEPSPVRLPLSIPEPLPVLLTYSPDHLTDGEHNHLGSHHWKPGRHLQKIQSDTDLSERIA